MYVDCDLAFMSAVAFFRIEFAEVCLWCGRAVGFVYAFACGLKEDVFILVFGLF
jgi:hypothetical protein